MEREEDNDNKGREDRSGAKWEAKVDGREKC